MAQAMAKGYSRHGEERHSAWIGECIISKCSTPRTVSVGGRVGVIGPKWGGRRETGWETRMVPQTLAREKSRL